MAIFPQLLKFLKKNIWIFLHILIGCFPLAFHAGRNLEYETSILLGFFSLLFIPWLSLPRNLFSILLSPFLLAIPASLLFLSQFCLCSKPGFFFWFLVNTYPAIIFIYIFCYRERDVRGGEGAIFYFSFLGNRRAPRAFLLLCLYFLLTFWILFELWYFPQKRLISFPLGFLHGPIYDEWIPVDAGILWRRGSHLFFSLSILLFFQSAKRVTILSFLVTIFTYYNSLSYFSTLTGQEALETLLPDKINRTSFSLHFDKTQSPSEQLEQLALQTQFHYNELAKLISPLPIPFVNVYIYPNETVKKLAFGGYHTDITDVFHATIHTTYTSGFHSSMRHELVHAMTSPFAYHGLGFHPNMAFTEGLAVALAPEERLLSLNQGAASLFFKNRLPPLENLFSPFFWQASGERGYTVAGSFLQYTIMQFGLEKVLQWYGGKGFEKALEKSWEDIISQWKNAILQKYDEAHWGIYTESLFRSPGVFLDLCPHSREDLQEKVDHEPFISLRRPVLWESHRDFPGWFKKLQTAKKSVHSFHNPPQVIEDVEVILREADQLLLKGDSPQKASSEKLLTDLVKFSETRSIGSGLLRLLQVKFRLKQFVPTEAEYLQWRKYLAGWGEIPKLQKPPLDEHWLLVYLHMKKGSFDEDPEMLVTLLHNKPPDPTFSKDFSREWYKELAMRLGKKQKLLQASEAWKLTEKYAEEGQEELYALYARYYAGQVP